MKLIIISYANLLAILAGLAKRLQTATKEHIGALAIALEYPGHNKYMT